MTQNISPILEVKDLAVSFGRGAFPAVRGLDFTLDPGEVVGLVGESGSGKSITAYSILGLLPHGAVLERGTVTFKNQDLTRMAEPKRRELCGRHMGMIFQEPLTALNPVFTVGEQVSEIFRYRLGLNRREAKKRSLKLLAEVGLPNPESAFKSYPHRFSGGMRQRVVTAMALALSPELVIADEPTTALDPTIATQIISLIRDLAAQSQASVLFITHNLRLLIGLAKRILVMYHGLVVEETPGFDQLKHPYSRGLWQALPPEPEQNQKAARRLQPIPGSAPGPGDKIIGCAFAPRCSAAEDVCFKEDIPLTELSPTQRVRCLFPC
ncbi:MAG: ABC transporter ATP-binding protein [Deltaproteobacteria bacterium]|jgi:oligopeptide/dipeptide ABC transporter ATP-binding protein|nr:ABC transporter ATP-binding protein [Deltaproteobacteria bacterium]